MTLKTLLRALALPDGDPVAAELGIARARVLQAVLGILSSGTSEAVDLVRKDSKIRLMAVGGTAASREWLTGHSDAYRHALQTSRSALPAMRETGEIGDDAFHA